MIRLTTSCEKSPFQIEGEVMGSPVYFVFRLDAWEVTIVRPGKNPTSSKSKKDILFHRSGSWTGVNKFGKETAYRVLLGCIVDFLKGLKK